MFYWLMKNIFVGPAVKGTFRPWITGHDNIPKRGPVILVSNHLSFIDSVFLPLMIQREVVFLAKSDYFTGKGLKGWATKMFFRGTGMLPIDRSGGKASEASLAAGLRVLAQGRVLGIYPEGTRSPDGTMYKGRTGVARMILEAQVPVVPVAMVDTEKVMPIGSRIPSVQKIGIVIGEPLDFSRFAGLQSDRTVLRSITDEIMVELHRLSGQQYRDEYATAVKARIERETRAEARTADGAGPDRATAALD